MKKTAMKIQCKCVKCEHEFNPYTATLANGKAADPLRTGDLNVCTECGHIAVFVYDKDKLHLVAQPIWVLWLLSNRAYKQAKELRNKIFNEKK